MTVPTTTFFATSLTCAHCGKGFDKCVSQSFMGGQWVLLHQGCDEEYRAAHKLHRIHGRANNTARITTKAHTNDARRKRREQGQRTPTP